MLDDDKLVVENLGVQELKPEPTEKEVTDDDMVEASGVLDIKAKPDDVKSLVKLGKFVEKKGAKQMALGMAWALLQRNREIVEAFDPQVLGVGTGTGKPDGTIPGELTVDYLNYRRELDKTTLDVLKFIASLESGDGKKKNKNRVLTAPPAHMNPAAAAGIRARN